MGIRITFFKTPQHRVFNYQPLYYDEQKEDLKKRVAASEREKAIAEGKMPEEEYVPGKIVRDKMRSTYEEGRKKPKKISTGGIIALVTLIIFFVLLIYFADLYKLFLESI